MRCKLASRNGFDELYGSWKLDSRRIASVSIEAGKVSTNRPRLLAFACHGVEGTALCRLHEYGTPHAQWKLCRTPKCQREVQAVAAGPLDIHGSACATLNLAGITGPADAPDDTESHQFPASTIA
jgi:hypothetical protein